MKLKAISAAVAATSMLTLSGCASIVGDKDQTIAISSTPSKADVTITDETSQEIFAGKTPTTVTLQKSDGSYFGGKTYTVSISKKGFEPRILTIDATPNGWYIAGNLVFGGLIGWLIVDPLTGSMYNLSPDSIQASLGESVASTENGGKEIKLVLVEDVPHALRGDMQLLGQL